MNQNLCQYKLGKMDSRERSYWRILFCDQYKMKLELQCSYLAIHLCRKLFLRNRLSESRATIRPSPSLAVRTPLYKNNLVSTNGKGNFQAVLRLYTYKGTPYLMLRTRFKPNEKWIECKGGNHFSSLDITIFQKWVEDCIEGN